jgi:hypothetical protein
LSTEISRNAKNTLSGLSTREAARRKTALRFPARSFSVASRNLPTNGVEAPEKLPHLGGGRMEERLLGTVVRVVGQHGGD